MSPILSDMLVVLVVRYLEHSGEHDSIPDVFTFWKVYRRVRTSHARLSSLTSGDQPAPPVATLRHGHEIELFRPASQRPSPQPALVLKGAGSELRAEGVMVAAGTPLPTARSAAGRGHQNYICNSGAAWRGGGGSLP
ncbi:hypothetical protein RR46_03471 [Papilio xuthus]|uniref:Uncharacterized protein n=1 Tax=Papilio xuthus TaxID=66420 RepID=A0A194QFF0_PAPXU|nr:hypothetical protein RR46_03471 [Papilio xuthus]